MLSDWPYFLKIDILYLGLCLEGHLSNLVSHFSGGHGAGEAVLCDAGRMWMSREEAWEVTAC